ncbi:MAG: hypothetical protein ACOX3D_10895 [Syntrophomonadales bacterium]
MEGFCGKAKNLIHNLLFWSGISVRKPLEVKIKFEGQVHQVDLDLLLTLSTAFLRNGAARNGKSFSSTEIEYQNFGPRERQL